MTETATNHDSIVQEYVEVAGDEPSRGHFGATLRDGNLFKALRLADLENARIMKEAYGRDRILASYDGKDTRYAVSVVDNRLPDN